MTGPTKSSAEAALAAASRSPDFVRAAQAFARGDLPTAERLARGALASNADDPAATLLLAEIADAAGVPAEAVRLLRRAAVLLPGHDETRIRLAELLFRGGDAAAAVDLLDAVLTASPEEVRAALTRAAMLAQLGDYDRADDAYRDLLARRPDQPAILLGHANLLRTIGRTAESAATYRRILSLAPATGEAWWGLADLKTGALGPGDIRAMTELLARGGLTERQALHIGCALGQAEEDAGNYEASFRRYAEANRIARRLRPYDPDAASHEIDRSIALLDRAFFDQRTGWGSPSPAPIFIVGMPRAGSTLVEQMLASHPAIEGTAELPYVPQAAHELLAERWTERAVRYPEVLALLDADHVRRLGETYLVRAAAHRKSDRPFFIDKLNDNWPHLGLIHLMLPRAVVIDARREAMACCFSNWKQHYARGRDFAYSQTDVARRYRDYLRFLDHTDDVLPGRVHRVEHERLVADPESELRRLLAQVGLPFDPACLRFHENTRAVRTASAAQVRRPLDRRTDERWRRFRPWLGEMEKELGPLAPR